MPDVRLYYIIEGMLEVKIGEKCYRMKKDDILVINVGVRAGEIETYESDALICELCFENRILAELLEMKTDVLYVTAWNIRDNLMNG